MRQLITVILLLLSLNIDCQNITVTENYLKNKYSYSDTIRSGQIQYLGNSIKLYNDSTLKKYLVDCDIYIVKFRGLICWSPDTFSAVILHSNKTNKFYIIEPVDRSGPDSTAMKQFENLKVFRKDKYKYCKSISHLFELIGNSNPHISEPNETAKNQIQIKYFNDYTEDKLWRLINFQFNDNDFLSEIYLINPKTGMNYKQE